MLVLKNLFIIKRRRYVFLATFVWKCSTIKWMMEKPNIGIDGEQSIQNIPNEQITKKLGTNFISYYYRARHFSFHPEYKRWKLLLQHHTPVQMVFNVSLEDIPSAPGSPDKQFIFGFIEWGNKKKEKIHLVMLLFVYY